MSLRELNYDVTEGQCPRDGCEGDLWVNTFELVCDDCSHVFRDIEAEKREDDEVHTREPIVEHENNREERCYENTGRLVMQGGFYDVEDDILPDDNGIYGMDYSDEELNDNRRRF